MLQGLLASVSGMEAQTARLAALADDVANLGTAGFKAVEVGLRPSTVEAVLGAAVPAGQLTRNAGVVATAPWRDWSEGAIKVTGRPLDLAIDGPGFFQVALPGGRVGLTRAGRLSPDAQGDLVDAHGFRVLGVNGQPIVIPPGASQVSVAADGTVTVTGPQGARRSIGQISLALPFQPDGLAGGPGGTWTATAQAGRVRVGTPGSSGMGAIRAGEIEQSNANPADVSVQILLAQQAYSLNAQAIRTAGQMWAEADQLRG